LPPAGTTSVTDDSLIHAVSVIRRALGDDPAHASFY
jgi:hypothetical protein